MPRWEPGTRDRLERAALELFTDRGYDETTVADIARRGGVTKATFFRTFPDKREVLFWGQDLLVDQFRSGLDAAPADAPLRALLAAALQAVATSFPPGRQALAPVREAIVDRHPDLRERRAAKRAVLREAIAQRLRDRGIPDPDAEIAAEIGRMAFSRAYQQWSEGDATGDFAELADHALTELLHTAARVAGPTD